MIDYIDGTLSFSLTQLITGICFLSLGCLLMFQSELTHRQVSLQNKKLIKTFYIISWNAQDAFSGHFSDYQVIHACIGQSEPLKQSLNLFCRNEYFKDFIDC